MKMNKWIFLLGFLFASQISLFSQDTVYVIQLGTFDGPLLEEFETVNSVGHIYTVDSDAQFKRVFLGLYGDENNAEADLLEVKNAGYPDAFITRRISKDRVYGIQLGVETIGRQLDWASFGKIGPVYIQPNGRQIRIFTGLFATKEGATTELEIIQENGFPDAFVKKLGEHTVHLASPFEMMNQKISLPAEFVSKGKKSTPKSEPIPAPKPDPIQAPKEEEVKKEETPKSVPIKERSPEKVTTPKPPVKYGSPPTEPSKNGSVKRTSVLRLQEVLKKNGTYTSSLDGLFGKGTSKGVDALVRKDSRYQKYKTYIRYAPVNTYQGTSDNPIQEAIYNIPYSPEESVKEFRKYKNPIAQAYLAYTYLNESVEITDKTTKINTLMNDARLKAFEKYPVKERAALESPGFAYKARYDYQNNDQLLGHLGYIHSLAGGEFEMPCWLLARHPDITKSAFLTAKGSKEPAFNLQPCGAFDEWENLRIMEAMAEDLNPWGDTDAKAVVARKEADLKARNIFFINPKAISKTKVVEDWHQQMWKGLDALGEKDALHQKQLNSFKLAYYLSQIQLENYFIDKGFSAKDASPMALRVMQTYLSYPLRAYVK